MLFPVAALTSVQTRVNMDLQLPQLRNFINGEVDTPTKDRGNALRNPNTGEVLQQQLSCDESQVETALAASDQAWECGEW
jgi:acyl-CoA reductase-like NAD-dependent aldehyde dehydrogenase